MIKEYRTIAEIAGPLMVVRQVERATFDELVEIELSDGSVRRGKVLEVNGDSAVVQLFEANAGINLAQGSFPGASPPAGGVPGYAGARVQWDGAAYRRGTGNFGGGISGHQRFGDESCGPGLSQ